MIAPCPMCGCTRPVPLGLLVCRPCTDKLVAEARPEAVARLTMSMMVSGRSV